jgi:hypothetical protein
MDGYNIFNAILKSKTPVDTYNCGIAASIAGVIFMAGRKRVMADYASLMLHNPFGTDDKKQLNAMRDSLVTMLSAKSHIAETEVNFLMDRTSWLNSAECFAKGFCTDIEVTKESNKKRMPALNRDSATVAEAKYSWQESNAIVNNFFKTNEINTGMKKVTNRLKLIDDASEDAIIEAITAIENKAAKAEGEIVTAKAELTTAKNKIDELTEANKVLTDAADAEKVKAEEAKKSADTVVLNTVLDKAVATGRIKADQKAKWIEKAEKLGVDEIKDLVENLPLNKTAGREVITGAADGSGLLKSVCNTWDHEINF